MAQIVKNICDNPKCNNEIKGYRTRVTHEYNSRSIYGREYCSTECALEDFLLFKKIADKRSMSD